jgi:hypothetical protein
MFSLDNPSSRRGASSEYPELTPRLLAVHPLHPSGCECWLTLKSLFHQLFGVALANAVISRLRGMGDNHGEGTAPGAAQFFGICISRRSRLQAGCNLMEFCINLFLR